MNGGTGNTDLTDKFAHSLDVFDQTHRIHIALTIIFDPYPKPLLEVISLHTFLLPRTTVKQNDLHRVIPVPPVGLLHVLHIDLHTEKTKVTALVYLGGVIASMLI